ncbi:MAG TPA: VOC family protein [Rubrobacteraceae bacterium]
MRRSWGYLRRAVRRGVEFSEEPNEQPWGMWAQFKDVDGNEFGLIQS